MGKTVLRQLQHSTDLFLSFPSLEAVASAPAFCAPCTFLQSRRDERGAMLSAEAQLQHGYLSAHSSGFSGYSLIRGIPFQALIRIKPMPSISVRVFKFGPIGKTIKRKSYRPGPDQ